jgi:hypothetical protein
MRKLKANSSEKTKGTDTPGISAYWMFIDLNTQPAFVQMLHVEPKR